MRCVRISRITWQERFRGKSGSRVCMIAGGGTDVVRVIVANQLSRQPHNAPLHLFSTSSELLKFGQSAYQRRSAKTSLLITQLFERIQGEGIAMTYTWEDFERQYMREHFPKLPPNEQQELLQALSPERQKELLQSLPPEMLFAALSPEQIRQLTQMAASKPAAPRKPRRKK